MAAQSLPSTLEKFNWAQQHFERLLREIDTFFKPKPYRIRSEPNADSTEYRAYLDFTQPLPSTRWGLIFGDGIHCLRSTLDHCVYLIAVRESGTDPPPAWRSLQFPITEDASKWVGAKQSISTLSATAQAAIEALQPHNSTEEFALRSLGGLQEFDNADKHRTLHVLGCLPAAGTQAEISGLIPGQQTKITAHIRPIKNDAPFMTLTLDRPTPDVKVSGDLALAPCLPHVRRNGVETALILRPGIDAANQAVQNVLTALAPFFL